MKTQVVKGTPAYKQAQELANDLVRIASYDRWNSNTLFNLYFDPLARFLNKIQELNVFASQIAKTIEDKMNPSAAKVASISSKQAWILACAAIENDIEKYIVEN